MPKSPQMALEGVEEWRARTISLAGNLVRALNRGVERDGDQADAPTHPYAGEVESILVSGRSRQKRIGDENDQCQHRT